MLENIILTFMFLKKINETNFVVSFFFHTFAPLLFGKYK